MRGLCAEFCRDPGRSRSVRACARAVPCGALLAAAEVAIEVAQCAIAPMGAHAAGGHRRARTRGPCVMWGTDDPLGMHGLPRVGAGAGPERLRPVLQACLGRLTFTYQQNRVVLPNVQRQSTVYWRSVKERVLHLALPLS